MALTIGRPTVAWAASWWAGGLCPHEETEVPVYCAERLAVAPGGPLAAGLEEAVDLTLALAAPGEMYLWEPGVQYGQPCGRLGWLSRAEPDRVSPVFERVPLLLIQNPLGRQ